MNMKSIDMKYYILILSIFFGKVVLSQIPNLDDYNIVWDTQSQNSSESMPCGGGDIGLNVWVENGDLMFYMARSGTFDENNTMLKLGRVRVKLSPNPFENGSFKQELDLKEGCVKISGSKGNHSVDVLCWVDVFSPVIHLEIAGSQKSSMDVSYENWRSDDRVLQQNESFGNSYKWAPPKGLQIKKDSVAFTDNAITFYHRNKGESVFDVSVHQQKLDAVKDQMFDPLKNLTFGGKIIGDNLVANGMSEGKYLSTNFKAWMLKSKSPSKKHKLEVYLHTDKTESSTSWISGLESFIEAYPDKQARNNTLKWWEDYWKRSYLSIDPEKTEENSPEWQVGRNYQLFRYMLGCNAFGEYPTKFNGGLFTYDPEFTNKDRSFTPDFRNWGGGTFTAQNQRLVYFPMLKSGDFEMIISQLDFYKRIVKNAELRSHQYWGHQGACFTEQIENFGLPNPSEYGWDRPEDFDPGMTYNAWLEYQWDTSLEFCWMALQLHAYQGAEISEYIPFIESCLTFFDEHYTWLAKKRGIKTLDQNGHLVFYPGSSCETYKMAYNATSTIVALKRVTEGLLQLPEEYLNQDKRNKWETFLAKIPPISFTEHKGHKTIAPAQVWERLNNTEAPQLYPVFPWNIYGVGKPDLEIAQNTYLYDPDVIKFKSHEGWKQYNIFAARLGLIDEATGLTVLKLQDSGRRFPAFWGPGMDWVPDHNWGGSGMIGIQEMLLQTIGNKILLFPTWPKAWDVQFKLNAPGNTTIEAKMTNGKVELLSVYPESRKNDIEFMMDH